MHTAVLAAPAPVEGGAGPPGPRHGGSQSPLGPILLQSMSAMLHTRLTRFPVRLSSEPTPKGTTERLPQAGALWAEETLELLFWPTC